MSEHALWLDQPVVQRHHQLARAAQADYLVSGDRHLLDHTDPDPPVLTPRQFLELLEPDRRAAPARESHPVQIWLFATPIAYSSSLVPERWRALYALNPMVSVIEVPGFAGV